MNYKRKIYSVLIISAIAFLISLVLALPEGFSLCAKNNTTCIDEYIYQYNMLATLLLFFSVPLFFISFACLFLQEQVFYSWSKFAIIFLPIAIVIAIWIAQGTRGTLVSIDEEISSLFLATIFLIVSILIITIKSLQLRGK